MATSDHKGLRVEDITDDIVAKVAEGLRIQLESWRMVSDLSAPEGFHSVLVRPNPELRNRLVGFLLLELTGKQNGGLVTERVLLKSKEPKGMLFNVHADSHAKLHPELAEMVRAMAKDRNIFSFDPVREIKMAERTSFDKSLATIHPKVYYTYMDDDEEKYFFITEFLIDENFSHIEAIEGGSGIEQWEPEVVEKVLFDLADFHASNYGNEEEILRYFGESMGHSYPNYPEYFSTMLEYDIRDFPHVYTQERIALVRKISRNVQEVLRLRTSVKQTLVHFDLTPKNLRVRRKPAVGQGYLCTYDWEFADINVPQHDLMEFLFTILPSDGASLKLDYIEKYRKFLCSALLRHRKELSNDVTDRTIFMQTFDMVVAEYVYYRFPVYTIIGRKVDIPYFPRLADHLFKHLFSVRNKYSFLL